MGAFLLANFDPDDMKLVGIFQVFEGYIDVLLYYTLIDG